MRKFRERVLSSIRKNLDKPTEAVAWGSLIIAALSLVISIVGSAIALASLYFQFFDKNHGLSFVVSSAEIRDHEVTFGVVFNNPGDYTEVVTNGDISLGQRANSNVFSGHYLESCFQPITIESKKAMHRYYTVQIPISDMLEKSPKEGDLTHHILIGFKALSPSGKEVGTSLALGTITHSTSTGKIEKLEIPKNIASFNFSPKNEKEGLGSLFVPNTWKPSPSITCHRANAL